MRIFKKLQENSLYWRYRFISRRWLAMKRWWRELRQPKVMRPQVRYRGAAMRTPANTRSSTVNRQRGITFVVVLTAAWTALAVAFYPHETLITGLARILVLAGVVYAFTRFW